MFKKDFTSPRINEGEIRATEITTTSMVAMLFFGGNLEKVRV
jgi:hypothetical protein